MDKKLILAIDFNNIVFTSYYNEKLINSKGMNVNAVKGFFFRLKMLKESLDPDYIVMANDISRSKTFRRAIYEEYKANRKTHDDDIMQQMELVSRICRLLGYPFINNELYEADDALGMISKFGDDNDMNVIIVSSDKDLYQLVSDNTTILSPRTNKIIDIPYMNREYQLTPSQWIEYKMLVGDAGDNIPGIRGIGHVTALRLMQTHGDIESIYKNIDSLKPGEKTKLLTDESKLELIRTLVTIVTDYSLIDLNLDMLSKGESYNEELFEVITESELHSLHNVMRYSLLNDGLKEYNS